MHVRSRVMVAAGVATVACATALAALAALAPPPNIVKAGTLVFCTDPGFPPMESLQAARPVGADIDIGSAIARSMGVNAQFRTVGFDGIIAALLAKKCDAIITGMTDTAQRREQVDFTDYVSAGMSLMVKKGSERHIAGLGSLCGLRVAVQLGTTENRRLLLQDASE